MKKLENIRDGKLISPITQKEISITAFDKETVDGGNKDEIVDISHDDAVNKNNIQFCPENNVMLSDYFPGNLFWDTHLGNMQQQSFTVKEYWAEMEERNAKRNSWLAASMAQT
jgi:hypothetical protein